MKNISVKVKITLWYTVFMMLLVLLSLVFLFKAGNARILAGADTRLKNTVLRSFREVEFESGELVYDEEFTMAGLERGVYLSVYDTQGNFLYGRLPAYYNGPTSLIMDEIQQEYDFYTHWYTYDYRDTIEGYGDVWIRGIASHTETDRMTATLVRLAAIIFPLFTICIAAGGYLITRRILVPLDSVTDTASRISCGSNLSERICLEEGKDEVHRLAHTFDHMMGRLQEAFDREKQFTSDVSHELRTPAAVIQTHCEYALSEDVPKEEIRSSLLVIKKQTQKITRLISQLLFLSRADQGKTNLTVEPVNVSELASIVIEEQQMIAAEKEITIHSELASDLILCADESLMMRFLINLLSNAIKYGKQSGNIWVTLAPDQNGIHGSVRDDGIGIAPEHLHRIWDRFYQIDPARTKDEENGAGLGLPMVKWIVSAHKGSITVESTPGEGSRFSFFFPYNGVSQNKF